MTWHLLTQEVFYDAPHFGGFDCSALCSGNVGPTFVGRREFGRWRVARRLFGRVQFLGRQPHFGRRIGVAWLGVVRILGVARVILTWFIIARLFFVQFKWVSWFERAQRSFRNGRVSLQFD
ncbi:MAG TPA: hypothetical protein VMG82_32680 [Candidatus Sulfotelmatobacter sp.]|nr:hypothetical protein [Candidatus Sulfotelmatobacter sp.]